MKRNCTVILQKTEDGWCANIRICTRRLKDGRALLLLSGQNPRFFLR